MKEKFYDEYFLQFLSVIIIIATVSDTVNWLFGLGLGLILIVIVPAFKKTYIKKEEVEKKCPMYQRHVQYF